MGEYVIVGLLVGVAVALVVRNVYRSMTGKAPSCSCGERCPGPTSCQTPLPPDKPADEATPK